MFAFIEWLFALILFFSGLAQFNDNPLYYDDYTTTFDSEMGVFFFISSLIVIYFAIIHTRMDDYDYYENNRNYDNTYNTWKSPTTTTYTYYNSKTQSEVVKDICATYPISTTSISQFTEHKVKKPSFFSFNKKKEVTTSVINLSQNSNREADLMVFDKDEERDIFNALTNAMQQYICYEDLGEIKSHLIHSEFDENNNINVFFNPSENVNIYGSLNRYCITEEMKKHLGYCEDIRFVEVQENFEDFYLEWKRTV